MVLGGEGYAPRREQPRQLTRLLVVPGPLERLAALAQLHRVEVLGPDFAARPQGLQRPLCALAAIHARRTEKDDRVLNLLFLEATERLEIFSDDADGTGVVAVEKLRVLVRERLLRHALTVPRLRLLTRKLAGCVQHRSGSGLCAHGDGAAARSSSLAE